MTYQSVTRWQANDYELEVRYGFFSTAAEAAEFGNRGIEAISVDRMGLWLDLIDRTGERVRRTRAPVRGGGFVIRRLRQDAPCVVSRNVRTDADYEVVEMSLVEMLQEPAMRSFGSLSFGVLDAAGRPVILQ
jgi:hypothetical protein